MTKWCVVYERHWWHELHKTTRFESRWFVPAWLVYHSLDCMYVMTVMPVKSISLYKKRGDLIILKSLVSKSRNKERLAHLKKRA